MQIYVIGPTLYLAILTTQTNSSSQLHPFDIDSQVRWSLLAERVLSVRRNH